MSRRFGRPKSSSRSENENLSFRIFSRLFTKNDAVDFLNVCSDMLHNCPAEIYDNASL